MDMETLDRVREWATVQKSNWEESRRWRGACYRLVGALDEILEGDEDEAPAEGHARGGVRGRARGPAPTGTVRVGPAGGEDGVQDVVAPSQG